MCLMLCGSQSKGTSFGVTTVPRLEITTVCSVSAALQVISFRSLLFRIVRCGCAVQPGHYNFSGCSSDVVAARNHQSRQ
eukprot:m.616470 g.616470  ORF g.616470 m.616470 type:complete len:79 (+) comp58168_c2_seq5:285-521(+)